MLQHRAKTQLLLLQGGTHHELRKHQSCSRAARRPHSTGKHSSILRLLQFTRL